MAEYTSEIEAVLAALQVHYNPRNIEGMKRFGIQSEIMYGVSHPEIKKIAKSIGKHHALALALWQSKVHEAKHIAMLIADPKLMTDQDIAGWRTDMNSWDLVDGAMSNCIRKTARARVYPFEWAPDEEEFKRRSAFALIAFLAVHNKKDPDDLFISYFPLLEQYAFDDRNFVRKAVNWALRSIGKRSRYLRLEAITCAERIQAQGTKSARWIAADALRELNNEKIIARLKR